MNRTEWSHRVINAIDPELVEEADAAPNKRPFRLRPAILVAACLCLLLLGTAVAAGAGETIPFLNYFRSQPHPVHSGFTSDGWSISLTGERIPLSEFSGEARTIPAESFSSSIAGSYNHHEGMDSWEEAEEFVDMDLMDNAVLEKALPAKRYGFTDENGVFNSFFVLMTRNWQSGELSCVRLNTSYDVPVRGGSSVVIHMGATFHTENGSAFSGWTHYVDEGTEFAPQEYTARSGLSAVILEVIQQQENGPRVDYNAYFTYNGGVWHIAAHCSADPGQALDTLQQILDAFR